MKYLFLLLFSLSLQASLTLVPNHNKEVAILDSFDIEDSFLYDPIMNRLKQNIVQKYQKGYFFDPMDEAYLYIPAIKSILNQYKIPAEFLYLAMAESNFSTKAYSVKAAAGLWQFMPETAKLYGLRIDEYVDERRDPIKSTIAAAKYLSALHKKFGKWYLAAIAYNCGDGRLGRAIKAAKSDALHVLLDPNKKYIPKESRFYIRRIVALAMLGNDEQFLLKSEYEHLLNRANAYSVATVKLPSGESLARVAKIVGIPYESLKKINRHLRYDFMPPDLDEYDVYLPYIKLSEFNQKYKSDRIENIYKVYFVQSGDSLSFIGKKFGVSYKVIQDFNRLKSTHLKLNQKLIIPIQKQQLSAVAQNSKLLAQKTQIKRMEILEDRVR